MRKIDYLKIIKNAWDITWRNRYLWWFGFFVSLSSFSGINFSLDEKELQKSELGRRALDFISQNLSWLIWAGIAVLLIMVALSVLSIFGRASLIKSINSEIKGEKQTFRSGFQKGKKYFWKIFALGLLLIFSVLAVILILVTPIVVLFSNQAILTGVFLLVFAVIIAVPIAVLLTFLKIYGQIYIVLGELPVKLSLENACRLFQKNLWESLIMSLFFIPLGILWLFAIGFLLVSFLVIFGGTAFLTLLATKKATAVTIAVVGASLFLIGAIVLRSIYETFSQSIWILFFYEIASPKAEEVVSEKETGKEADPLAAPVPTAPVKTFEE